MLCLQGKIKRKLSDSARRRMRMVYDRRVSLKIDDRKDLHSENHNTLDDGYEENTANVEHYHLDGQHSMVLTMVIPLVMVILIGLLIIGDSALFKNQVNTTSCKPDDFLPLARERYHPHKALNPVRYSFAMIS